MGIQLRSGLLYTRHCDDIILMDVLHDRILALPRTMREAFIRAVGSGEAVEPDIRLLQPLIDRGILLQREIASPSPVVLCPSPIAALATKQSAPSVRLCSQALAHRLVAAARLRIHPFHRLVTQMQAAKQRAIYPERHPANATCIASAFQRTTRIVPSVNRCLPDSVGLATMLVTNGIAATMVIGVRTAPFASHCWVQIDDVLVNEAVDHVRGFSPLLVI